MRYWAHPKFASTYDYTNGAEISYLLLWIFLFSGSLAGVLASWAHQWHFAPEAVGAFVLTFLNYLKWRPACGNVRSSLGRSLNLSLDRIWDLERDVKAWGDESLASDLKQLRSMHFQVSKKFIKRSRWFSSETTAERDALAALELSWLSAVKLIGVLENVKDERVASRPDLLAKGMSFSNQFEAFEKRSQELGNYLKSAHQTRKSIEAFTAKALADLESSFPKGLSDTHDGIMSGTITDDTSVAGGQPDIIELNTVKTDGRSDASKATARKKVKFLKG